MNLQDAILQENIMIGMWATQYHETMIEIRLLFSFVKTSNKELMLPIMCVVLLVVRLTLALKLKHSGIDLSCFTRDVIKVRRIMLILLAERLYTDLVEPAQHALGKSEYCLRVTTELLGDFISALYLKNLPRLQERQQKVRQLQSCQQDRPM